jgi:tetratricopeptide (TPR) repeat protein
MQSKFTLQVFHDGVRMRTMDKSTVQQTILFFVLAVAVLTIGAAIIWVSPRVEFAYHGALAESYHRKMEFAQSVRHYEAAKKIRPHNFKVLSALCFEYPLVNRVDDGLDACKGAIAINPKDGPYVGLGIIYKAKGDFTSAALAFHQAVIHEGSWGYMENYASALMASKQYKVLIEIAPQWLEQLKKDSRPEEEFNTVYEFLAVSYEKTGDKEKAREMYQKAEKLGCDFRNDDGNHPEIRCTDSPTRLEVKAAPEKH